MAMIPETNNIPSWDAIFETYGIDQHDFDAAPFLISSAEIGAACQHFTRPSQKEARILCKQDTRESRSRAFRERGLFILPVKNRYYAIVKGEGYVDIPTAEPPLLEYPDDSRLGLGMTGIGSSAALHFDAAHALGLIRLFTGDDSLVLTIRGRKFTGAFQFKVGECQIDVNNVQTEVDGGYEGANQVVLVEAKNGNATNNIIRQLYYPYRQWQQHTDKPVSTLFFQRTRNDEYHIWHFAFEDVNDYNSIRLLKSARYKIILPYS